MKKLIEYIKLHGKARIDNVKKFLWSKEIEDTLLKCNFTWTHGIYKGKVLKYFNPKNKFHKRVLEEWKAENTKFYRNAIYVWTKLDPLKQKTAKKNKLNYKVFWYNDLSDFNEWYNGLTV